MRAAALDKPLLGTTVALAGIGLAALYSAGITDGPSAATGMWERQALWLIVGGVAGILVYRVSPRLVEWAAPAVYGTAILLLIITLFFGTGAGTAAGTRSWLAIGNVRIGQPAEIAKVAVILMLARHLGSRREAPTTLRDLIPSCLIAGVPALLVALQPDLGSAVVFLALLFAGLFWVGTNSWLLLLLASPMISLLLAYSVQSWGPWIIVVTALIIWLRPYVFEGVAIWMANVIMGVVALQLWSRLAPYQQSRLLSFLNPESDPRATGWHIIQSKVAIGSGGLFGKGFAEGTQKRLAFLPAQHTDFIFSVVGEELGFLGVTVVIGLFGFLLLQLVRIARRATDPFSSLLAFGIVGMVFAHVVENIGMTVGLMPITGIPLPFFSYGGSFMITMCAALGVVMRIAKEGRSSYAEA